MIQNNAYLINKERLSEEKGGIERILVVDDEENITGVLSLFLKSKGYFVSTAKNGEEALKILKDGYYDLVLSDIRMPRMDGLALLKEINKLKSNIITIMLTGFATIDTAVGAMKLGAFDYVVKPFTIKDIHNVVKRADERYKEMMESIQLRETTSLYDMSEAISSGSNLNEIFRIGINAISREVDADAIALYLKNKKSKLFELKIRAFKSKNEEWSKGFIKTIDEDTVNKFFKGNRTVLLHGREIFKADIFIAKGNHLFSIISIPLKIHNKIIGILNAYSFKKAHIFTEGQKKSLLIFSNSIAVAVETTRLYDNLQQTFKETMLGLAAALEARDKYTNGHSYKVSEYAQIIAEGLGLSQNEISLICQAAKLHDIGKIGIDNSALNKPEKLNKDEHDKFKDHIMIGMQIIQPISFLSEAIPLIYYHHEFFNGSGYPEGRRGEEIPLGARILQVADAFDAMTSDRPYRKALSYDAAVSELRRFSGTQFDPEITEVFIKEIEKRKSA
ncbi:MAG: response regulator [Nitrospirae bacterium]|nr:response regulator [Nitrospirota bacterium]